MIFLHENKHQSCIQDGSIVFTGHTRHAQSTQNSKLVFCNISKRDEVNFLHGDELSFMLIPLILVGLAWPARITKITRLQNLQYFKKEVKGKLIFVQLELQFSINRYYNF